MKEYTQAGASHNSFSKNKSVRPSRLGPRDGAEMALGKSILRAIFEQVNGKPQWHLRRWRLDQERRAMRPCEMALLIEPRDLPKFYSFVGEALARARREGLLVWPEPRQ